PGGKRKRIILGGEVPSPISPPPGCPFHPRCPQAMDRCRVEVPALKRTGGQETPHQVACHLYD
ncbi:MAG: peptide ABC transporter ATP-binding protein, partial [Gammaproteobacteria bacterium]